MCVVKKEASCFSLSKNGHAKNYNTIDTYATKFQIQRHDGFFYPKDNLWGMIVQKNRKSTT